MLQKFNELIYKWLVTIKISDAMSAYISSAILGISIIIVSFLLLLVAKKTLHYLAHRIANRTKTEWDDILLKHKFFTGLAHFIPASIIYFSADFATPFFASIENLMLGIA